MATIRCDIVSAEEGIFHGVVTMVIASGEMGELVRSVDWSATPRVWRGAA